MLRRQPGGRHRVFSLRSKAESTMTRHLPVICTFPPTVNGRHVATLPRGAGEGERRSLMHHLVACFCSRPRAFLPPQPVITPLVCAYYPSKGCRLKSENRTSSDPRGQLRRRCDERAGRRTPATAFTDRMNLPASRALYVRVSVATRNPRWLSTPPPITSHSFKEPGALRRSAGATASVSLRWLNVALR